MMTQRKTNLERRILWKYGDVNIHKGSMPFSVKRTIVYTCQYGKPRRKSSNENMNEENDHQYIKKKRFLIQTTKKVGCEAKLVVRYITSMLREVQNNLLCLKRSCQHVIIE
ncbi:uncharacterized protein LOC134715461 [Mytilus trossulus]|uniref:uncharacterized protein LOC134715461 n=1 Tax=Mytilus trossulus TaxID=6551 RepID=UPI003005ED5C